MNTFVMARTACGLLTAAVVFGLFPAAAPAATVGADGKPLTNKAGTVFKVVGHRGGAGQWPENSLQAFSGSGAAGYDGIETDVAYTKDGVGVMSHDDTLPARCTNAGRMIHTMTLVEVQQVRCADLKGKLTVPIPTFAELAGVLAKYPRLGLTLDFKSYAGHSGSGRATYAKRGMALLKKYGLLSRTRIVTYYWRSMLPTIRKASKSIYVVAYDNRSIDLAQVRKADLLKANGYGIRMTDTSAFLARYIRSKGMDVVAWQVSGTEQRAFSIHYAGKDLVLLSDHPETVQRRLESGKVELNPTFVRQTTTLAAPVVVSKATFKAGRRQYPLILGVAVPAAARTALDKVTLSITVTGGTGKVKLTVGPRSADRESLSAVLPKRTATISMSIPVGDDGRVRVQTSSTVGLSIAVTAYSNVRF